MLHLAQFAPLQQNCTPPCTVLKSVRRVHVQKNQKKQKNLGVHWRGMSEFRGSIELRGGSRDGAENSKKRKIGQRGAHHKLHNLG